MVAHRERGVFHLSLGMDMNAVFVARMQLQLKIWDADIDALAAESAQAGAAAHAAYQERIRDLRASRAAVRRTLQRMQKALQRDVSRKA
jgi:hypothetical protein